MADGKTMSWAELRQAERIAEIEAAEAKGHCTTRRRAMAGLPPIPWPSVAGVGFDKSNVGTDGG